MVKTRVATHAIDEILRLRHECGRSQKEITLWCQVSLEGSTRSSGWRGMAAWQVPATGDQ